MDVVVNGIPEEELNMAITSLKANGYNLFGNAISTSDIRYQIISTFNNNITLFSPTDSDLYSLDLVSDSSDYVQKLRYHVSLNQFSFNNLSSFSFSNNLGGSLSNQVSFINTLIPHHCLTITKDDNPNPNENSSFVSVDGVRIVVPDLYTGSRITVHGLGGILSVNFRKNVNDNVYSDLDLGSISSSTQSIQCFSSYVPPVKFPDQIAISTTSFSPPPPSTVPVISPTPASVPADSLSPASISADSLSPPSFPVISSNPDSITDTSIPASVSVPATSVAAPAAISAPIPVSLPVITPPPVSMAEILPAKLKGSKDELDVGNKRERGGGHYHHRGHHHHYHHRQHQINVHKKFHRIRRVYDLHHEDFL